MKVAHHAVDKKGVFPVFCPSIVRSVLQQLDNVLPDGFEDHPRPALHIQLLKDGFPVAVDRSGGEIHAGSNFFIGEIAACQLEELPLPVIQLGAAITNIH